MMESLTYVKCLGLENTLVIYLPTFFFEPIFFRLVAISLALPTFMLSNSSPDELLIFCLPGFLDLPDFKFNYPPSFKNWLLS